MMEKRQGLAGKLGELEQRLRQMSLTLTAALQLFAERGFIPRDLLDRFNRTRELNTERISQYTDEAIRKFVYSLLDEMMESLDEEQMPHG
jgi:ATP-dependent helicase/DNAse subunit B